MKFAGSLTINKSRQVVTELFTDPSHMHKYQDGFKRKELQSGIENKKGAISMIYFDQKGRKMVLKETIINNNLPLSFKALYEHKHMDNTMVCNFEELDGQSTLFNYEFEYIKIKSFVSKVMMKLVPSMFQKPAHRWMRQFKNFVETYEENT